MNVIYAKDNATGPQSQGQHIHDVLIGRIQRGELGADMRLVDTAVATEFGVSRMPARDALMRLAHEGYLEATTRGFVLPRVAHDEILEIFDLRRLLEPRAAALAARALSEAELAKLAETLADARRAMQSGDTELLFKASEKFRNGWISAVPNGSLKEVIRRYMTQIQAVRMLTFAEPGNHPLIVNGNAGLLDAFSRRDAVAAADRISRFVYVGETAYLNATDMESTERKPTTSGRGRTG